MFRWRMKPRGSRFRSTAGLMAAVWAVAVWALAVCGADCVSIDVY